jgi:hypothetical protein
VAIDFATHVEVEEILSNDRRFTLSKDIKEYALLASRAEDFFTYLVSNPSIMERLTYDFTTDTRAIVMAKIKNSEGLIVLRASTYAPLWRFSDIIAYQSNNMIYFNKYKLKRASCNIIATFVHEYLHRLGYSHGDNNPKNKENSVPYYVGNVAKEACLKGRI